MKVLWLDDGWRGFVHWIGHDPAVALKIATLIDDARRHPFTGLWPSRSRCAVPTRAGGRGASPTSTGWSTASPAPAPRRRSKSRSADFIIEATDKL